MKVACIGSRDLKESELQFCQKIGQLIAEHGWELHTGNASGADQAFAVGANKVDPKLVHLHLPWASFKRDKIISGNHVSVYPFDGLQFYVDIAADCHPRWNYLKDYAKKLHARNVSILIPDRQPVDVCIAWPSRRAGGGGTGQGMRIAKKYGIELLDLTTTKPEQVCRWLQETP